MTQLLSFYHSLQSNNHTFSFCFLGNYLNFDHVYEAEEGDNEEDVSGEEGEPEEQAINLQMEPSLRPRQLFGAVYGE